MFNVPGVGPLIATSVTFGGYAKRANCPNHKISVPFNDRKTPQLVSNSHRSFSLSKRLEVVRDFKQAKYERRRTSMQQIADALVAEGYGTVREQAKALGVNPSTAWTIMNAKHKLARLSAKTTDRMLANPQLPTSVRAAVQRYLDEELM